MSPPSSTQILHPMLLRVADAQIGERALFASSHLWMSVLSWFGHTLSGVIALSYPSRRKTRHGPLRSDQLLMPLKATRMETDMGTWPIRFIYRTPSRKKESNEAFTAPICTVGVFLKSTFGDGTNIPRLGQHTAKHCSIVQHTVAHCNMLPHTATHYRTTPWVMVRISHV